LLVAPRSTVKRILAALSAFDVADRPMTRLDAARRLREAAEELEAAQVEAARKAGATWLEIGALYGLTKQGAQQRFRAARKQAEAASAAEIGQKAEAGGLTRFVLAVIFLGNEAGHDHEGLVRLYD
jgi:hypothetical protein